MKKDDKECLLFVSGFTSTVLSLIGWFCIAVKSQSIVIWIISILISIFIAITNANLITEISTYWWSNK